jgi:hypothetical protein
MVVVAPREPPVESESESVSSELIPILNTDSHWKGSGEQSAKTAFPGIRSMNLAGIAD